VTEVVVAYVPVLHEGYRRFLEAHAAGRPLYVIGRELYEDYRPLAKDIRALDPELVASALRGWELCASVEVLDVATAERLAARAPAITMPAEDVSYQVTERFFARCPVRYDTVFLRWDKTKTVQMLRPENIFTTNYDALIEEVAGAAEKAAAGSVDWWRQVGAAIVYPHGDIASAVNEHLPHPQAPYAVGDPRSNFYKGVALELSTAAHAEARLIAQAARDGKSTSGAVMYVTDFPCPPCAKLIAGAGIARLYFRAGYAVLDGRDVLEAAGVQIVQVA
jgi:dCMP deaminase